MFSSSGEGREAPTLLGLLEGANLSLHCQRLGLALSKGTDRVDVPFHSSEGGKLSNFRNIIFYNYFEFRTMNTVHKHSDSEGYTPSLD
jgi:hypothetical protein